LRTSLPRQTSFSNMHGWKVRRIQQQKRRCVIDPHCIRDINH
jgi:hypothetical protein